MIQLEYYLGSVSVNLETFLGFSLVLSFSPLSGETTHKMYTIDCSVGRVLAFQPGSNPAVYIATK